MQSTELFGALGWVIGAATLCVLVARLVRLPPLVAYLLAGVLLGPLGGVVQETPALRTLSELGVVLLLFLVGIELDFGKLFSLGRIALMAGLGQIAFTFIASAVFCVGIGWDLHESLWASLAVTFSSTVVAVKLLSDKGDLDTDYGRIAVGISIVQSLVVIFVMALLSGVGQQEPVRSSDLVRLAGDTLLKMAVLVVLVLAAGRKILPRIFQWLAVSSAAVLIGSLFWCLAVVLLARKLELVEGLGALLAGLAISDFRSTNDIKARIKPLMSVMVAVFFVVFGAGMDLAGAASLWPAVVGLSALVIVGNTLFTFLVIPRFGFSHATAFGAAVTGAQTSEFTLFLVTLGAAKGLLRPEIVSLMGVIALITITVSAYLILHHETLYDALQRAGIFPKLQPRHPSKGASSRRQDHIIVIGMNSLGRRLAKELTRLKYSVLAMDTDARKLADLPCETLVGSSEFLDVLLDAGMPRARLVISALRIEEANELLAYRCSQFKVPCCVHAVDLSVVDNLLELGVAYLMLSKVDGVKLQNRLLRERGLLPA